jgi:hypothetical protein
MFSDDDDGSPSPTRRLLFIVALMVALGSGFVWHRNREENPGVSRRAGVVAFLTLLGCAVASTQRVWMSSDDRDDE